LYLIARLAGNWSDCSLMETRLRKIAKRARIVLMTADGHGVVQHH
jgi:hypothetical protein